MLQDLLKNFTEPLFRALNMNEFLSYSLPWTPERVMIAIIAFTFVIYFWENYLSYRQYVTMKNTISVPPELVGVMDQATFTKARLYSLDKSKFAFFCSMWEQFFQTMVLLFGGIPFLWMLSEKCISYFGYGREYEATQTVMFSFIGSLINTVIDLPFSLYSTFVIEESHGFNKQTLGFFFKDKAKKFGIISVVVLPILACIVHIVKIGGDFFFAGLWLFCVVIALVLMTIYPDYIAPLFDKFTPLPEGNLRDRINQLASSIDFPLKKLYIVEGSKRSAHSNAYFYGFYKNKRIVLFDTLLETYSKTSETDSEEKKDDENKVHHTTGCSDDEVISILAHELGHWKLNHSVKNMVIFQVNMLLSFFVFGLLYKNELLFAAFGFNDQKPVIVGFLIIFQYVFSPYNEILSFLMTILSRHFEFQADAFAKEMHKAADLRSALVKLEKDNLTFPVYDWLYSAWNHSHPPLLQRIKSLGKLD